MKISPVSAALVIALGLNLALILTASAASGLPTNQTQCFDFRSSERLSHQTWCYMDHLGRQGRERLVFEVSQPQIKSELSALIQYNRQGQMVSITQDVLSSGQREVVRVDGMKNLWLNPLPVAIDPKVAVAEARGQVFERPQMESRDLKFDPRVQTLLVKLSSPTRTALADEPVTEGHFSSILPESSYPWRSYWWPFHSLELALDSRSPLQKYSKIMYPGQNPMLEGPAGWERRHHAYMGSGWNGHCNAWAAASILYPEPKSAIRDFTSGETLEVLDQKALLMEISWCVERTQYGSRYDGEGDQNDIYPHVFHKAVTHYLRDLKKAIVLDHVPGEEVDNHVASGYTMDIAKIDERTFDVSMNLQMHGYDSSPSNQVGVAPIYNALYQYRLKVDAQGQPISGTWTSSNPDFIWVPLGQKDCYSPSLGSDYENPEIRSKDVYRLLRTGLKK